VGSNHRNSFFTCGDKTAHIYFPQTPLGGTALYCSLIITKQGVRISSELPPLTDAISSRIIVFGYITIEFNSVVVSKSNELSVVLQL